MRNIVNASAVSFLIRILMIAMEFLLVVVLTRTLGLEQYGAYAFYYSIVRIISIPLAAGLPSLTVRQVAFYVADEQWGLLRGFLKRTNQLVLGFFILMLLASLAVVAIWPFASPGPVLYWTMAMVPLMALANIRGAALRGMHFVVLGQIPESVIRPILFAAFVLLVSFASSNTLDADGAMFLHLGACALTFAFGWYLLFNRLPDTVRNVTAIYKDGEWLRAIIPFSLISGVQVLNDQIGIFSLGILDSSASVGHFQIALQLSLVVGLPITALNISLSPHFARLHQKGQIDELKTIVGFASFASFSFAIAVAAFLLVFGEAFLGLIFGADFADSYLPMMVLVAGQVVSAATGSLFPLSKMLGEERVFSMVLCTAAIANLAICLALIPLTGTMGAAVGSMFAMVLMNLVLAIYIHRKLGINSLPSLVWIRQT